MTAISRPAPSAPAGAAPAVVTWLSGIARVFEYRLLSYRRTFRASIFNSFVGPALFLAAIGVGLGTYVDAGATAALDGVSYLAFLAPGLLAATAMQTASFESTFPIMGGLVWNRVYHAMYATPIRPRDIALGNLAWIGFRVLMVSSVFVLVTALFVFRLQGGYFAIGTWVIAEVFRLIVSQSRELGAGARLVRDGGP